MGPGAVSRSSAGRAGPLVIQVSRCPSRNSTYNYLEDAGRGRHMSGEPGAVIAAEATVTVYPSSATRSLLFSIPAAALKALGLSGRNLKGVRLDLVVEDVSGHLIRRRQVELTSGPEVKKSDFRPQVSAGQLHPGQRIRLWVSLP